MKKNNEILNDFFELDKNQRIPLALTFRLLFSKKCRNLVRLLTKAEKLASKPVAVQVPVTDESITAVLQKLSPEFEAACSAFPLDFCWSGNDWTDDYFWHSDKIKFKPDSSSAILLFICDSCNKLLRPFYRLQHGFLCKAD